MSQQSRRQFLKLATGVVLIPALNVESLQAADLAPLREDEPTAVALKYKKSAADAVNFPNFKAGSRCDNCMHYQDQTKGCNIFPGKSVEPGGWCAVWAAKPA
ncbi:high-potential iron-sulfur protein [Parendozoicomonas sp. Alg238-R29]|uniref:high-potential iron-sulfur protein n=1 Tax=Parendozoicomonas sp. Alg238-R29 TaxID=2993446 RepID=UPI00248E95B9|nr:high-potential iron-sulfur protein [Parendozoicomonas sp. Alg238-R29]